MNFYKRHIGDYAKDTGELTLAGHGVFGKLLDWYYANERPIPSFKSACTIVGTSNQHDMGTVRFVLQTFFSQDGESFRNKRADHEIAKASARREMNAENGKLGGRPKQAEAGGKVVTLKTQMVLEKKGSQTPDTNVNCTHSNSDVSNVARESGVRGHVVEISKLIHKTGLEPVPNDPRFIALVAAGAPAQEFVDAARDAVEKHHSWSWALGKVSGRRRDAARLAAENAQQAQNSDRGGVYGVQLIPGHGSDETNGKETGFYSLADLIKGIHQPH